MDFQSVREEMSASIAPFGWEKASEMSDSEESECNSSSQSIPLTRRPSLAEICTITQNCSTSPISKTRESRRDEISKKSVELDVESAEIAIAILAANRSTGTQLKNCRSNGAVPTTPPKPDNPAKTPSKTHHPDEPLTPTANLMMLVSAASPAIRDREIKKRELFTDSDGPSPAVVPSFALPVFDSKVVIRNGSFTRVDMENGSEKMAISRKDKSLGLLCQRFLAKYPEYPPASDMIEISLDEVAKDLSVERRRIYDIVNVLESVEVISRFAKNRYMWHGKTKLPHTLQKLKKLALSQGFSMQSACSFGKENPESPPSQTHMLSKSAMSSKYPRLLPKDCNIPSFTGKSNSQEMDDEELAWAKKQREADYCRKDKSLGVLSQKFLMMFLISDTRQVTLDDAANLLIDNKEEGQAKFKTKVRRLYDIANILSSLQLIQKVHIHNIQTGRKPGFRWIGMDLDKLDEMNKPKREEAPPQVKRFINSRQSLLRDIEDKEESLFGRLISRRPSQQQLRRFNSDGSLKSKLPRSRSDQIRSSSCDDDSSKESIEDGYSIQEITDSQDNSVAASPTAVKFQSELKKLQEQYPDRMSQLLSACRQTLLTPDTPESKKSRRMLFVRQQTSEEAPAAKKSKPTSNEETSSESERTSLKKFVHSATSPFKPIRTEDGVIADNQKSPLGSKRRASAEETLQSSPEQKILLERRKQKKLLEEQKDFQLEDERWKRMERELDRAFPQPTVKGPHHPNPTPFNDDHSSVGIQTNLIEDVSPLKPLSYYVKNLPTWQPIIPKSKATLNAPLKSATPSPVQFQNMGVAPLVLSPSVTPTPLAPANHMPVASVSHMSTVPANHMSIASVIHMSTAPANHMSIAPVNQAAASQDVVNEVQATTTWTSGSCTPPSGQSTPSPGIYHLKMPQQPFNSPALYSPRSLTPSTPTTDVNMNMEPKDVTQFLGNNNQPLPVTTMTLPISFVNSLINNRSTVGNNIAGIQGIRIQTPHSTQGFNSPMVLTPVQGHPGVTMATPILPKGVTPQHLFTSLAGETPSNSATFMHTNVAKSLVLPEHSMPQH